MIAGIFLIDHIIAHSLFLLMNIFLLLYLWSLSKECHIKLEDRDKEYRDLNAAKDKFISVIAHDLKTPAANIESLSKMVREKYNELSDNERIACIDMLVESAKTHNDLLNTLLDLSRLRLGNKRFNPEKLDICQSVHEVLEQTKLQAQQKQISQTNQSVECFVNADRNMITTVLRNLVVNAIKFTHPGGIIVIRSEKKDDKIIISVADTGIGIDDAKKDSIFEMDSNKSTAGTANEIGTGLGLLLCKEYVEHNGGKIWFESESEKGTTFFFSLPLF